MWVSYIVIYERFISAKFCDVIPDAPKEDLFVTVHSTGKIFSDACGAVIQEGGYDEITKAYVPTIWETVEVRMFSFPFFLEVG